MSDNVLSHSVLIMLLSIFVEGLPFAEGFPRIVTSNPNTIREGDAFTFIFQMQKLRLKLSILSRLCG